ncbi:MAG: hydantoinase/oxoprolinase family protein, partial [Chromatiales bacterium]|nr:hydantoinase/oxoprolinase family protein [Chromatiales bacterium]
MSWRMGVDIGGTFTDVAAVNEATGQIGIAKLPTTPRDFAQGVIAGLRAAMERLSVDAKDVGFLSHATTVVTNALLEEKGARIGLIATRGFRDVLELRRSARSDLYDMFQDAPAVLVPRSRRYEVTERLDAQGEVVTALDLVDVDTVIEQLRNDNVEAIAVCLLYSFLNDQHERAIAQRLADALPDVTVFLSCDVLPEIREFERTSTTAVCAYVGPILASYLHRLETTVADMGLPPLYVMGSSGGVFDVAEGLKMPAMAVESGPAAGVIAAQIVSRQLGIPNVLSFDMGGTTAKASLIEGGVVETTSEYEVGGSGNASRWLHGTGHPIRVPVIDLAEVSAGGGSIAWLDPAGALRVGPGSAGAEPGPVCYGNGGTQPTVTDCDVVLGFLSGDALLGGDLGIDLPAARAAIDTHLATPLGLSVEAAASGVLNVVNASMAEALRIVSVERGYDAREFALVAFGGAGPVHAAALADELEIPRVIIPPVPGAFSALGLVGSDLKREYSRTFYITTAQANPEKFSAAFRPLESTARQMIAQSGLDAANWSLERSADCRYMRQAYELNIGVRDGDLDASAIDEVARAFHEKHLATYGHSHPEDPVQLVNVRVSAVGRLNSLTLKSTTAEPGLDARIGTRTIFFEPTAPVECDVV